MSNFAWMNNNFVLFFSTGKQEEHSSPCKYSVNSLKRTDIFWHSCTLWPIDPQKLFFNVFISEDTHIQRRPPNSQMHLIFVLLKSQHSDPFYWHQFRLKWECLKGDLLWALNLKTVWNNNNKNNINLFNTHDTEAFCTAFFDPSVIPPPLLHIPFVAKQYLAKILLTSRECVCCKATIVSLKILKSGEEGSSRGVVVIFSGTTLFWTVFGEVGQAPMWVCISVFCIGVYSTSISSPYNFFSISILPLLYTLIMTTMMSLKKISFSLSKISKHKSLYRNDNNVKNKK